MPQVIPMIGKRFGRLTVIEDGGRTKNGMALWLCRCDCGNTTVVRGAHLRSGAITSCRCYNRELVLSKTKKHGEKGSRLYRIWRNMKTRCLNPKCRYWNRYGGRGISICAEWLTSFEAFRDWALSNGYEDHLTIDRINNDGNYEPSNCRWATMKEQANNRGGERHKKRKEAYYSPAKTNANIQAG